LGEKTAFRKGERARFGAAAPENRLFGAAGAAPWFARSATGTENGLEPGSGIW